MPTHSLRTTDLAAAAGVHPNTVRLYETWGFLPPVPRSANGYRCFTPRHLAHMQLARAALDGTLMGEIKKQAALLVQQAAQNDLGGALERAYLLLAQAHAERDHAAIAATFLQHWANGTIIDATTQPLSIKGAAKLLGLTPDVLRNWERNALIVVPRDGHNGYRRYGAPEIGRLRVIKMLRSAGYSMMAVLRIARALDAGQIETLRAVLDTPPPHEDVYAAADRLLSALAAQEARLEEVIAQLEAMLRGVGAQLVYSSE